MATAAPVAMFDKVGEVTVARRVPFTTDTARLESVSSAGGFADVFYPVDPGPWPVVVFLHGASDPNYSWVENEPHTTDGCPMDCEGFYDAHLTYLAERGAVVFSFMYDYLTPSYFRNLIDDLSCIGPFVASRAIDYGGDPARTVILGHSRGATVGSGLAMSGFAADAPANCLEGGSARPTVVGFVGLSGDYPILAVPHRDDPDRIVIPQVRAEAFVADEEIWNTGVTAGEVFNVSSGYAHLDAPPAFPIEVYYGSADADRADWFAEEFAAALADHGWDVGLSEFEGRHWETIYLPVANWEPPDHPLPGESMPDPTPAHLMNLNATLEMAHG